MGSTSAAAAIAATPIITYGVPQRPWSRPTALGIWRLVASEYPTRVTPSIAAPAAANSPSAPPIATAYLRMSASHLGWNASTTPSTGALMCVVPSAVTPSWTGSAPTPTSEIPT